MGEQCGAVDDSTSSASSESDGGGSSQPRQATLISRKVLPRMVQPSLRMIYHKYPVTCPWPACDALRGAAMRCECDAM